MVKKVLVKPDDGAFVNQSNVDTSVVYEVINVPYGDEANYEIDFTDASSQFQGVIESSEVDHEELELTEGLQTYEAVPTDLLTPDVVLAEKDVEVAAYATLSADSRSGAVPAVVLEANMCPLACGTIIKSENHLRGHLKEKHAIQMQKEVKQFPNMGSFLSWKEEREREATRRYVVRETRHNWRRFACSRSGYPSGTDRPQRWKKTGNFCPAYIRTKTAADGSVKARYSLLHTCKQPDNTALPSEREVAKANQQLSLLERAISDSRPRKRRRRRSGWPREPDLKVAADADLESPGRRAESVQDRVPPPHTEPTADPAEDDRLPLTGAVCQTAGQPHQTQGPRPRPAAVRDKRKTSCRPASDVKQRVRTNLLRLHAKLELATEAEAQQMLLDTADLLERHTNIRRRGRTGTLYRRRLRQRAAADHQYGQEAGERGRAELVADPLALPGQEEDHSPAGATEAEHGDRVPANGPGGLRVTGPGEAGDLAEVVGEEGRVLAGVEEVEVDRGEDEEVWQDTLGGIDVVVVTDQ